MKNELLTLADYHAWAFEILYDALLPVSDEHYRADCGLFFRSMHGTLNHLLVGDRVWFGRFAGTPYTVSGLDAELESDRVRLERALYVQTVRWRAWIERQSAAALTADLAYTNLSGTVFTQPVTLLLLHVFNHATHHRGQLSAAVSACGYAVPEMDLIWYLRRLPAAPA